MAFVMFAQEMYFPIQSTQCLSAYLKKGGHRTDVAIGSPADIVEYVRAKKPDLIAFSVLTAYRNHMLDTSDAIKAAGIDIPIIAGGYDITFMPQILEHSALDMICIGEGGAPLVELADAMSAGKDWQETEIKNLHVKRRGTNEVLKFPMRYWLMKLDEAPFDDRDIYYDRDPYFKTIPFIQVLAGRGCPYPCTYCFNAGYKKIHTDEGMSAKEYTNLRSVDHVMAELKWLAEKYDFRDFFFNDSTLTYNRKWIIEFCRRYKESGLPHTFSINAVIHELTEDVCAALADTGKCRLIRFGLETGNDEFRAKTLRKNVRNAQFIEGTERMTRYGLRYSMQMMLGLPGETMEYAMETIDVARRISNNTSVHGINIFKPFPGLEINNVGLELGEYRASDVAAPGAVPPPAWRRAEVDEKDVGPAAILPADEAYMASRATMHKSGGDRQTENSDDHSYFGSRSMVFFDNYRRDNLGLKILKLSRYSHLLIRFPELRVIVEKIIELPDNAFNRAIWTITEGLLNIRVHAAAPWSYFVTYFLFHRNKQVR
ncbi:MAG: radical SAM protein [Alphaproteobacteria bacterium]|nr:radical SAM protein [Alphaproteobacteria bacterium]